MPNLAALKAATSLTDIAGLLGVKPGMLSYVLYKQPKPTLYKSFSIPKKHGGLRAISSPDKHLKLIQHRLSKFLQSCEEEIRAKHDHVEASVSHGFKKGYSFITNAREHVNRRYVFNIDLEDFFGTINFGRVRGYFLKDKNFSLQPAVATVIAQIACNENKLPQGSPCSPVISNLLGHTLDIVLIGLAKATGCFYSRYADDITFSTNKKDFPSQIAQISSHSMHSWEPGKHLLKLLSKCGFSVNSQKTRMQYSDSQQSVTGLTVNQKVNVPVRYRRTTRAMAEHVFNTGMFEFVGKDIERGGALVEKRAPGKIGQLIGMLSHIDRVDTFNRNLCEANGTVPPSVAGRVELFRRVLYYSYFFAPQSPLIVCEGKTDNVYLKNAIKRLATTFPLLCSAAGTPELRVRFFKYSERRTNKVTQIVGGVGGLCHLIKQYFADTNTVFKPNPPKHPVVLLIDNDAGAHSVYGAIAGILKTKKPAGHAPYIYLFANLYVVPTPFGPGGSQTKIEDFFDAKTLSTPLNGKTFDASNDTDTTKHYGKAKFAHEVIAKSASSINFDGFIPMLERLNDVIEDYRVRLAAYS